jgi:catechol 2,3-dioxygenase-like lactoylglutathione lyase family enzyme
VKRPFALEGLDHVTLLVTGMDAAQRFYVDVLGCEPESSFPQFGMELFRCGAALIVLVDIADPNGAWAKPPVGGGRNMDHVCLALSRFGHEEMRSWLAAHEVAIIEESFHGGARGESLSFYVRDPFGNVLELKGPPAL